MSYILWQFTVLLNHDYNKLAPAVVNTTNQMPQNRHILMYTATSVDLDEMNDTKDLNGTQSEFDSQCPPIYEWFEFVYIYYVPFIIFMGLVGNFLACIVFLTTHLKMRSSSYYLAALATADFGFLSILLLVYLSNETELEIFNKHGWCQCLVYVSSVCSTLSVWLIVAFTVERFIAVQYPLQRPHMCTVSRAKAIVLVLTALAMATQSYSFVTAGMVHRHNSTDICEMLDEYKDTMRIINVLDTLVTLIGPFILIVVMNAMIARNLCLFQRRFQHGSLDECLYSIDTRVESNGVQTQMISTSRRNGAHQSSGPSKYSSSLVSIRSTRKMKNGGSSDQLPRCIHIKSSGRNIISTKSQQNITKMLLLISTVFILLNLPSYVIRLYVFFFYQILRQQPPPILWCLQQFVMILYYTNFSINFLLYAVCGATFRRCLTQLLRNRLAGMLAYKRTFTIPQRFRRCSSTSITRVNNQNNVINQ